MISTAAAVVEFPLLALKKPVLMGIINVTPNSFSDGGKFLNAQAAIDHGMAMAAAGAEILDIGGEASSFFRPGVGPVDAAEQLRRVLPVVKGLRESGCAALLSVDTRSSVVARRAVQAGAQIINDISAGTHDPEMPRVVADMGCATVLMHIGAAYPENPQADAPDILRTVRDYLEARAEAAGRAGIARERILIDPGLGFGKTARDNWELVGRMQELLPLGFPVVVGASRKRFLEFPPPHSILELDEMMRPLEASRHLLEHQRDAVTAAVTVRLAARGIMIHRVHNVPLNKAALQAARN